MSYVLVSAGRAPFVLSVRNAEAYFELATVLRHTHKNGPFALFRLAACAGAWPRCGHGPDDAKYLLA